ncbi:hypothetical protein ACYOEI_18195 [Singulisphaera rosea]
MKRRWWIYSVVAITGLVAGAFVGGHGMAAQDTPSTGLDGTWKLIVLTHGDHEFAVVKLDPNVDKPAGSIVSAQKHLFGALSGVKLDPLKVEGDSVTIGITCPDSVDIFRGKLVKEGPNVGKVLGNLTFRGETNPARLEKVKDTTLAQIKQTPITRAYASMMRDPDPKSKVKKARDAIDSNSGQPACHLFYSELLATAEANGLSVNDVKAIVDRWENEAEPYGVEWSNSVRIKALKALAGAKPYAEQTLKLAQKAEQILAADASKETRSTFAGMVARSARLAGESNVATAAEARRAEFEAQLDEEYHKTVPPFTPGKYEGRKNAKADRVVVMELFTGAECAPCVAADVGFDALFKSYAPSQVIGLQYHLNIPGPDPLTNGDSQGRMEYYAEEVQGTPSTFFNGRSLAGGGGPMKASEQKYKEFRRAIDERLESEQDASIHLSATRRGDQIEIQVQAKVDRKSPLTKASPAAGGDPLKDKKPLANEPSHSKPRLRLALTEEAVHYVGGNRLRFHHHVVRAFPGGIEGKDLSAGDGQMTLIVNLANLKQQLTKYAHDATQRPSPNLLSEIELKHLSVVAFVQDDADKAILHAVSVPTE